MTKIDQQIELLLKSVEKWQDVVDGIIPNIGSSDCPLCIEYHVMGECTNCPLHEQGEEFYCFNTDISIYQRYCEDHCLENAEEMLNMLEYMVGLYKVKRIHDNS